MKQLIQKITPENIFKRIFYLHVALPVFIVMIVEAVFGRRIGVLSYAIAALYISYSLFRLIKERSFAPSTIQKYLLPLISVGILY